MEPIGVYRDSNGRWREISTEFVEAPGDDFAVRDGGNAFDVAFKETLEEGFMQFAVDGTKFDFTLGGAASSLHRSRAHGLSYDEAMPGVDLDYSLLPQGVKETLVLRGPNVPTSYKFTMTPTSDGPVHVVEGANGSWDVYAGGARRPGSRTTPPPRHRLSSATRMRLPVAPRTWRHRAVGLAPRSVATGSTSATI